MAYEYQGFASLSVNLNRQKYGSLDISEVFVSQADLNYYISKGAIKDGASDYWLGVTPYPYAGQYIALVNNTTREVKAYILVEKADGTFETKEVGSAPIGDEKSITVDDKGIVKIVGFEGAEEGAQPRKKADGTIEWIKPDTTTVEGLETLVAGLESDVGTLQADKANKSEVYTKNEVDNKLSSVYKYKGTVKTYSALPTADRVVGDVYNVEAADAEHGIEAGDNVAWNGTGWDVLGGTVDLSDYAKKDEILVKSVDTEELTVDANGNLTIKKVANSKVDGLAELLDGYVKKNGADRLITETEANKLKGIEENADANIIEIVKLGGVALEVTDKAVNIPVAGANLGVIKSSAGDNKVNVSADGVASVSTVNVNTLTQTDGEALILNGGSAAN